MKIQMQYRIWKMGSIILSKIHNAPMIARMLMAVIIAYLALPVTPAFAGGFNGNGTYNRFYNWTNDAANGINITASRFDTEDSGFATGLSTTITKDGQQTTTARIPFAFGLSVSPGTVMAPGFSVTGDTTTGFYQTSTGTLSFGSEGSYALTLDAKGIDDTAIGIGSSATARFTAVGIGTSVPTAGLNVVVSGTNYPTAYFATSGAQQANIQIDNQMGAQGAQLEFDNVGAGKWTWGLNTSPLSMALYDLANMQTHILAMPNGSLILGPAQKTLLTQSAGILQNDTNPWVFGAQIYANGGSGNGTVAYTAANGSSAGALSVGTTAANLLYLSYQPNGPQSSSGLVNVGALTTTDGTTTTMTGTWKTTTQSVNTSNTTLATTAFANPANSFNTNGYQKSASGMIDQWGTSGSISTSSCATISLPITFPAHCYNIQTTMTTANNADRALTAACTSTSQITICNNSASFSAVAYWRALGN